MFIIILLLLLLFFPLVWGPVKLLGDRVRTFGAFYVIEHAFCYRFSHLIRPFGVSLCGLYNVFTFGERAFLDGISLLLLIFIVNSSCCTLYSVVHFLAVCVSFTTSLSVNHLSFFVFPALVNLVFYEYLVFFFWHGLTVFFTNLFPFFTRKGVAMIEIEILVVVGRSVIYFSLTHLQSK